MSAAWFVTAPDNETGEERKWIEDDFEQALRLFLLATENSEWAELKWSS